MEGRLLSLLRRLAENQIEFILVGGLSAALNGAPIHTQDVDIVHRRDPANLDRLLLTLKQLEAIYRHDPDRNLRPSLGHLASPGHHNLVTRLGWLDLLGTIGRGQSYDDILPHSHPLTIADALAIQVLDLAAYIAIKESLGQPKDLAMLPILRQTLREKEKSGRESD